MHPYLHPRKYVAVCCGQHVDLAQQHKECTINHVVDYDVAEISRFVESSCNVNDNDKKVPADLEPHADGCVLVAAQVTNSLHIC
jgi:hypothetical protein